jgi:hypothetical protein
MLRLTSLSAFALLALACSPKAPPRWQEGGAPLVIAPARWDRGDDDAIEIKPDGKVYEGDDLLFVVDRVGRIADKDYEPFGVLLPEGTLAGTDNRDLGRVGMANAAPPGAAAAWLAILPNGQVIFFDEEGDRHHGGVWRGCEGPQKRTCTLVTHALWVRNYLRNAHGGGLSVGVGVMMVR